MRGSLILVVVVTALAGGCGSAPPRPSLPANAQHNAADIAFAQALIPHHRTGIAVASEVARTSPAARTLAEAIIVTQQDEVARMVTWLNNWGAPPASPSAPARPEGDPVRALAAQQAGAIAIAQREQANGSNREALDFARRIVESRTAQLSQLRAPARS
jgi:uncharacterized protein (DUF305 family)